MQPKTVVPLNAEQQALAARWLPLARKVAARHGVDLGVCLEGLCRAARGFDASKGWTFQALATRILTNAAIDELRKKRHVEVLPFDESLHASFLGHADPFGDRQDVPEPVKPWTPPPDVPEKKTRPPGTSQRSAQRRAKAEGAARPVGHPRVLDGQALLRVLTARRNISTAQLAEALGVSRNLFYRCSVNRQLLARMRTLAAARIFEHAATPDRAVATGQDPRLVPATVWR